jgi:hypothetical protein
MRVVQEGTIFAGRAKTDAASACFANVCALPGGRWLAGFRLAPAKSSRMQRAVVSWSDDQGATWSPPTEPAAPLRIDGRPGTWRAVAMTALGGNEVAATLCWEDYSDPFVPMFNEKTEGLVDMKLFTATSADAGQTFAPPLPVDCGPYRQLPTPITGALLPLPGGGWAAQFEVNKTYDDLRPWQHVSALAFSPDRGRTWSGTSDVHTDPDRRIVCWDQRLTLLRDGTTLGVFWTFDRATDRYLNIHARASADGGRNWGELWDTGVSGQPARAVQLADGRLLMTYVDRTAAPTVKCRTSGDGGRTWPADTERVIHNRALESQTREKRSMQDAWSEMSAFSIGLPDAVALPDGDVLVTYYSGDHADLTDVRWARLRAD